MDLRIQVPGLSYFSIEIVLGHTRWSFWVDLREEGYAPLVLLLQCQACPSLIVAQSGGGDGFLFRPSMIPVLNVVRRWSLFASASGSVALSLTVNVSVILLRCVFKLYFIYLLSVIVISTGPLHPLPGWYDIVAELRLIRARTGATPCVR